MSTERRGPLSRFKVIDLTRARAGPTAARHFADFGADVIKVEMPTAGDDDALGGDRNGPDFFNLHRNKRSLALNLKAAEGVAILKKLAATADVLIENYRPDVKHRLGIDYETLRKLNPRLVYVSISGFGQDGPYANRPGFDQIAQGMGGLMSITGLPGQGPVRVGIPVADLSTGTYAAMGALIALLEREVSGEGQWVQSSLLQAQISMLDFQAARWTVARQVPGQAGNDHPTSIPTGVFPTADGHINIAASGQHIFKRLCEALDAAGLFSDPDFNTADKRSENRVRLNAELAERTRRHRSGELVEKLNAAGVRITMGTDGNRPWAPHEEMEDMVVAGMTPMQVLVAATRNSAELLRLADTGTLQGGKSADFIVLDANPVDDIKNTRRISAVYLIGAK